MAITKLQPFNLDSTANYTFANITTSNANLGNAATANFFIGSGNNLSNIQGGNVTGQVGNALVSGTIYTNAQPNITSVGTLTTLNVSGNANLGNLGTTNFIATGTGSFGANVNMNGNWINNVGYPSATTDVATKSYVDTMVSSGISYHQPVAVATTTTLATATGGTTSYVSPNGAANGIGAYISTTGTYLNIDGANVQTIGTRILVKDEANATWNGVYTYANTTAIIRSSDTDEYGPDSVEQLSINDYFFVQGGSVNKGVAYVVSAPTGTITFGTSNIVFSQFSTSQIYTAGTGLTLTDTTFSVNASQTQITSVGTLTGLSVNGNIIAANITANTGVFTGNGSGLSAIAGANVSGAVAFATTANSVAGANVTGQVGNSLIAGTVYTAAQPNITSVGTLSSLTVSGTTNLGAVGNVTITGGTNGYVLSTNGSGVLSWVAQSGGGSTSSISNGNSNVNIPSANGNVNISAVGNANVLVVTGTGANISGTANITGNVSAPFFIGNGSQLTGIGGAGYIFNGTSNANIATTNGNLVVGINGTASIATFSNVGVNVTGYMTATGNVTGGNLLGPLANGNSNVRIATSNGNVTITAVGNTTMTITGTGANISGTANITGNVSAPFFIGNGSALTGIGGAGYIFNGTSNANIATSGGNLNIGIGGTANVGVFTSTGLNVAGYANITGNVNAPFFVGNGFYLSGIDAAGRVVNGTSNLQILQNSNLTISVNGNANIVTVTGTGSNISGYLTVTGNVSGGNISTSGQLTSTQSTGTAPLVVLSTTQVANLNSALAGSVTTNAQPNITSVGNLNGLIVSNATSTVDLSNTANVALGAVANLHISGGSANYVLKTDGSGNLDWVAVGGISVISSISNGNSNVNIATSNGNVTLTAVGNTTMTVTGTGANISGYANITGNVTLSGANINLGSVGNLRIAGGASSYVLSTDGASNLSWVAQSGDGGSSSAIQEFSATSGQTTFTVVGGYQVGSVIVFVNGIQMNNADYTASNGTTVVLSEPRISGDIVRILSSMASPAININSLQNFSVAMSIALGI